MPRRNVFHACSGLLDCKTMPSFIHFIIPAMLIYLHASSIRARRYAEFFSEPQNPWGKGQALVAVHPEITGNTDNQCAGGGGDEVPHRVGVVGLPREIVGDVLREVAVADKFEHFPHHAYREREGDGEDGHEAGREVELEFLVLVQGVYEHVAGRSQKKPRLEMEELVPQRNAVVEAPDFAQEKREENEDGQPEVEGEGEIQTIALFED